MNILKFNERFPDEAACIEYFKAKRIDEGVICKKCKGIDHYWLHSKHTNMKKYVFIRIGILVGMF